MIQKKCAQYWPDEGSLSYGGIKVTLDKNEPFSDFIIRTFAISKVQGFFISNRYITFVKTLTLYLLYSCNVLVVVITIFLLLR